MFSLKRTWKTVPEVCSLIKLLRKEDSCAGKLLREESIPASLIRNKGRIILKW